MLSAEETKAVTDDDPLWLVGAKWEDVLGQKQWLAAVRAETAGPTVVRSPPVGQPTDHPRPGGSGPPACAPRRSCTAHRVVAARRARRRLRRSEMPPVDIAAQSRHRSAVARSLAVGQITTHPPWPLRPAGLPAPRSTGTRRAHARAKHRRCCCPWRRAAWRPPVLPSSPEREEHARAVAVSPRTAADENAEQCGCLFWQQRLWR